MHAYLNAMRHFSHDVRMYLVVSALYGIAYFGINSVLLNLYLLRLDYGNEFIGLVNASTALAFALTSIPAGAIGARWGYRYTVIAGVALVGAGSGLLPLAEYLPLASRSYGIIATRLCTGFGFALYVVNTYPYLVGATSEHERGYVFSIQVALSPTMGFVGSLIAGILPDLFAGYLGTTLDSPAPFRYPIYLSGLLLIPAVLALFTTSNLDERAPGQASSAARGTFPLMIIGFLAITALLRMTSEGAARSFFNVYLDEGLGVGPAQIGLLTAIGQLLAGPAALFSPAWVSRYGKERTIVYATFGIAASLFLMGSLPHWSIAGLGFMGVIGMLSIVRAVANVVQMEIVAPGWRGVASGIISTAMGMGFSSMALGGGYLASSVGYPALFLAAGSAVTLSALLFWVYFRVPRGEYARLAQSINK